MENNEQDLLALLEPQWRPDVLSARVVLDAKLAVAPKRFGGWNAAITAVVCLVVIVAFPETRAVAQGLWQRFALHKVGVIHADFAKLPLQTKVRLGEIERNVPDLMEAEKRAGFRPYLPPLNILDTKPDLAVTGPISIEQIIHVSELESALQNAGAGNVHVPKEWEGVALRAELGAMVSAKYPDDVQILQTPPAEMLVPAGFALDHFAETALRSIGVSWHEARALGREFAAHPFWMLDVPVENKAVLILDVTVRGEPALLWESVDLNGSTERAAVVRTTFDRTYVVTSGTREMSLKIANALP